MNSDGFGTAVYTLTLGGHSYSLFAISQALIDRGVIVDFREPDIIRFGIAPLYNQSGDIDVAVSTLADILNSGVYREQKFSKRATVT